MARARTSSSLLSDVVAENVRRLREDAGLSQEAFAERCGYHRTYIGAIERGERNITLATLSAIAKGLGVHPKTLLVGHENEA